MKQRFLPPTETGRNTITLPNGQSLTVAVGSFYDAAHIGEATLLGANGWLAIGWTGATTARPTGGPRGSQSPDPNVTGALVSPGFTMVDATLNKHIVWDGAAWRDPTGTSV